MQQEIQFQDDFESGDLGKWADSLNASCQSSVKQTGAYAAHIGSGWIITPNVCAGGIVSIDFYWRADAVTSWGYVLTATFQNSRYIALIREENEFRLIANSMRNDFPIPPIYTINTWHHVVLIIDFYAADVRLLLNDVDCGNVPVTLRTTNVKTVILYGTDVYIDTFILYSTILNSCFIYMTDAALEKCQLRPYRLDAIVSNKRYAGESLASTRPWGVHIVKPEDRPVFCGYDER
jgi:hypothetical protein